METMFLEPQFDMKKIAYFIQSSIPKSLYPNFKYNLIEHNHDTN